MDACHANLENALAFALMRHRTLALSAQQDGSCADIVLNDLIPQGHVASEALAMLSQHTQVSSMSFRGWSECQYNGSAMLTRYLWSPTKFTCAFRPGCPMSHIWLPNPDSKFHSFIHS